MMGRAFEAGWAGAVTKTLVTDAESIVNVTPRLASLSFPGPTAEPRKIYAFENIELVTDRSLSMWLKEIEGLRKKHPGHVVIASIMDDASRPDGWQSMARKCEAAGAHMIELNMSCPHGMPERGMGSAIGMDPNLAAKVTRWTVEAVKIPVMAKMTPNVTDVGHIARTCEEAGVHAISAINTVAAIIGIDLETLVPRPNVAGYSAHGGLSGPAVKPIALKAIASIARSVQVPISGIGGIASWEDAAEFLLIGATTLQVCSAVMARGYGLIEDLTDGLSNYMEDKGLRHDPGHGRAGARKARHPDRPEPYAPGGLLHQRGELRQVRPVLRELPGRRVSGHQPEGGPHAGGGQGEVHRVLALPACLPGVGLCGHDPPGTGIEANSES